MSIREEQCNKVCRILDDALANRPTERDSLIIAVRKAFESFEQFGNSEPLPSAQPEPKKGKWIMHIDDLFPCESTQECSMCHAEQIINGNDDNFCPNCGADMRGEKDG